MAKAEKSPKVSDIKSVKEETDNIAAENNILLDDISQGDKILASIGYISFFCILALLKSDTPFVQFHGKQGLIITIATMPLPVFGSLLSGISVLFPLFFSLGYVGLLAFLISKVFKGETYALPRMKKLIDMMNW